MPHLNTVQLNFVSCTVFLPGAQFSCIFPEKRF